LRLVAQYADACNFFVPPEQVMQKIDVLRRHCDAVKRDIRDIEVTALLRGEPDWTTDHVLRGAEAYAAVGVATVMAVAVGADPASVLQSTYGPAAERLAAIAPKPL
jgi:alkanesulfonate monooxygenase SsuD/methylene tetrahydromethanopterin reductase-like flavin-dependent oxidoreductase (luciferase family)